MDTTSVYQLFGATYHPDPEVRKQAEVHLKELEETASLIPQLFEILNNHESDVAVKQAVSIYFKNRVRTQWDPSPQGKVTPLNEADKQTIRENILQIMVHAHPSIRVQLVSCLTTILHSDFPDRWANYLPYTRHCLESEDPKTLHTGLLALFAVVRFFQWKVDPKERAPLDEIIAVCFPLIQQLGTKLVNVPGDEPAQMLKVILRCYHSAIQGDLSIHLQSDASLQGWLPLCIHVIQRPNTLPADADLDDVSKDEGWKARKWALRCLNRLFSKYGNPALLAEPQHRLLPFAEHFMATYGGELVRTYFEQVQRYVSQESRFNPKCLCLVSTFFSDAIKHKTAWKLIKPHTETLVEHFIFPQLMYSEEDDELWEDNPTEYIHKKLDPLEDFDSPTGAAVHLLRDLATDRRKHCFMIILSFINAAVMSYAKDDPVTRDPRRKDSALCMLGSLAQVVLHKKSPVRANMEEFVTTHVFPEFKSPNRFLRMRALMFYCEFSDLEFRNRQCLPFILEQALSLMQDPEIPVRVQAALSLQPLIEHENVREAIVPHLPQIMTNFLALTNQLDIDTLAGVMESFVETFSDQMAPYSFELCGQLAQAYLRIVQDVASSGEPDNEGDYDALSEKTFAAMGILRTISTLIMNLESSPQTIAQLESQVIPLAIFTLQQQILDLYEDVFEILESVTFATERISPAVWGLLPLIYRTFSENGLDYFDIMLPTLINYVTFGSAEIAANSDVRQCFVHFVRTTLQSDRFGENDRICAARLTEALLVHCRGHYDAELPEFIRLATHYLFTPDAITTRGLLVFALEMVLNSIYYNPHIALEALERMGVTQAYFAKLSESARYFRRVHDKKLLIVALCTLLGLPPTTLPPTITAGLSTLFGTVLRSFETLPVAVDNRRQMEKVYEGEHGDLLDLDAQDLDDYETADFGEGEDDEDDDGNVHDKDQEYLSHLAQKAAKARGDGEATDEDGDDDDDDDDEDDEDEALDEEMMFESPLDKINVYAEFRNLFNQLKDNQSPTFQHMTQGLDGNQQQLLMTILNTQDAPPSTEES
ncbi:Nonsense-mediated mRNA decay protein 5 [Dimargaris cristalligena]|uniref:Armadillo-type protein n=1 Tax=Dimargaris cristalligena TaxID=215637 RepID=A0A4P9ZTH3_9FUNG|nr:Nonsense-mediated mRNA decay protein 5 [Dimargaris cristalligena]RKP35830.1 armadillo-type protein [Dimargaris cristalligena]|eukprot:RKP35830.1 armadillo-type protein [Dimargaris cristalligena]